MSRRRSDPLRPLTDTERTELVHLSRSQSAPAGQVARARALLAVADGHRYDAAARLVGHLSPVHSSIALIYHAVLATEWPISWQMTH